MSAAAPLRIRGLSVSYPTDHGRIEAVRNVDVDIAAGEFLGIVGESGSGKTQLLLSILGLSAPRAELRGSIRYRDQELLGLGGTGLNRVRGDRISMVFQDPMTALNPYLRIGRQITEVLQVHRGASARARPSAVPSRCWNRCTSRKPRDACASIRMSCRGACANA